MKVPLLDLRPQLAEIEAELKAAVNKVIDSTHYILGPEVVAFEKAVAQYVGAKHAIGVSSGTDALLISLMALEVGPGDLVLTTPYSFFATAGAIVRVGARPVFVDIDPESYTMDPEALHAWFDAHPKDIERVKAIIPVHLYGQCADMNPIRVLARRHDIPVVEDAAQALGASYPAGATLEKAGAMGATGCFSFFPSKNLGCIGDGGMVTTNDAALAERIALLRNHGAHPKYYHSMIGGNFRLDAIQAAVLNVKLPYLDVWNTMRRDRALRYDEYLSESTVRIPTAVYGAESHIYNQYIISVPEARDDLRAFLNNKGIGHEVYYPVPFHLQACFADLGYKKGDFPHSEYAAEHTVALPVFPELSDAMQDYVISKIKKFYA